MKIPTAAFSLLAMAALAQAEEPASVRLEEVVVKGKGRITEISQMQESNVARIIIPRAELDKSGDQSVSEYLKKMPGLGPVGNKGRNIAGGAPQILIDGVAVAGGRRGGAQLSRISLDMVERIEVTRSPTAALANESAGAVVNIILKNAVRQSLKAGLNLAMGEDTSRLGGVVSGQFGAREDDFSWIVIGSYYQRGNLLTTDSEMLNFDPAGNPTAWTTEDGDGRGVSRNLNLTPKLTWQLNATDRLLLEPSLVYSRNPDSSDRSLFSYTDYINGSGLVPNGSNRESSDNTETNYGLRSEWQRKDGKAERLLRVIARRSLNNVDYSSRRFDDSHALISTLTENGDARNWEAELNAQVKESFASGHLLTGGAEYAWRDLDQNSHTRVNGMPDPDVSASSFDVTEQSWVAYVQDEWAVNASMSLTPGLRFRYIGRNSKDGAGVKADANSSTFSPSLHALWKADEQLNLRASAAHILKPPSFTDLTTVIVYRDGTQTSPDVSGNPDLDNETAWVYNFGLEYYLPEKAGVLGVNVFYRDISELIQRRTLPEGARYVSRPINIGDASIWGVELDGRAQMGMIGLPSLTLRGNFVTQNSHARDDATGETGQVGDLPEYTANIGIDYEFTEQKLTLSTNLRLTGRQNMGVGDPESVKPQQFLSINANKKLSKGLTLRMGGHNLLNEKTRRTVINTYPTDPDSINSMQQSVETAARTFYVSLESIW